MIKAIIAIGKNGEIGQNNDLPWGRNLPKDLKHFKEETLGKKVIMGNNTFKSLPFEKGFPERNNMVITSAIPELSKRGYSIEEEGQYSTHNFRNICSLFKFFHGAEYFIIGGASIYKQLEPFITEWIITRVDESFPEADTFFEPDLSKFYDSLKYKDVSSDKYSATVSYWKRKG